MNILFDVLVNVDIFILLANFVVLDCDAYLEVLIILGKSFLVRGQALIDVKLGEL